MKNRITDNLGLKILSVLVAVLLWIMVTGINDPAVTKPFYNIPVTLENTELITDSGQVYQVLDNSNVISRVSIRAPQSILSEISDENIVAVADVSNLSSLDTIKIDLSTNIYQTQINSITGSIDTVKLNIENRKTKTLPLSVEITGSAGEGYIVGDYNTDQNLVRISGAESVIDKVYTAKAEVDVSGFTSDVRTNAEIKLYDEDENAVISDTISQNLKNVAVNVMILQTKEVPVIFNSSGEAQEGYIGTGIIDSDRTTAKIYGKSNVLKDVESIEIPREAINISEQRDNYTTTVDITPYLPDGVSLTDPADAVYTVTVYIEAVTYKHIPISASDVSIINVPDGYSVTLLLEDSAMLDLVGLEADLEGLSRTNIEPIVDITGWMAERQMEALEEGFFGATLQFTLPNRVVVVDPVEATLHIVEN